MEQTQESLWLAILATIGEEGKHWDYYIIDAVEWNCWIYAHQN